MKTIQIEQKNNTRKVVGSTPIRVLEGRYKKYVQWKEDDTAKSLSLYSLSKRAYSHLLTRWNFPLPSESTLKRWLQKIDLKPEEMFRPVLKLLDHEFASSLSTDRISALSIDEMEIDERYCCDPTEDQVLGGLKTAYGGFNSGHFSEMKASCSIWMGGYGVKWEPEVEIIAAMFILIFDPAGPHAGKLVQVARACDLRVNPLRLEFEPLTEQPVNPTWLGALPPNL